MDLLKSMKTWFIFHLLLGYIFLMSGLIVCFLLLLMYIFVWPLNRSLYRKIVTHLGYMWWSQFTFLGQWWADSKVKVFIENSEDIKMLGKDHTIVLMNHKYEVDWLVTWIMSERLGILGGTKIYGKQMLKFIPLLGWAWTFTESIFLKREWEKDKKIISKDLEYICEYPKNYWVTLLLFCEGTRFTEAKKIASNEVARKKGLKELKHHLLPRTKGFVLSMHGVKDKINTITDMTVGFTNEGAEPKLINVINGKGLTAEVYLRRLPTKDIPLDTDEACANWLHKLYERKDEIFDDFDRNGHYTNGVDFTIPKRRTDLYMWIFWAVTLCVPLFKYLGGIFLSGSVTAQISLLVLIALLTLGFKKMIGLTLIEKASAYGASPEHKAKQNGSDKSN